ncbi:hypothetical protein IMSAG249_01952 [Lachnospiraceae bacterium]|nr:hypothetical protein IMSAG249_01952 [Lachnospiraceae bacterium]
MGKSLRDMTRQEQAAYFKSKDYCGEQLKVVMDAVSYGISIDYLQLFEDTTIPVETMETMFTAMKEDYGVKETAFLSTVHKEESGRILLEALKSGVPLSELQGIYQEGMLPIELREKILPLMQGRKAIPEKIGERMEFLTETVRELKESLSRQGSFIEDLKKSMEEKTEIFSVQEKEAESITEDMDDAYYLELEEQFRQAREDAERLLEEREETNKKVRELEAENKHLHEQLLIQQSYVAGLQEQQRQKLQGRDQQDIKVSQPEKADCQRQNKSEGMKTGKQLKALSSFSFPFIRKKPGLLEKLAGELDAGQIAEVRLGIEDGLTESQLALLANKAMDAEKMRELRMTMKILNERGQGT